MRDADIYKPVVTRKVVRHSVRGVDYEVLEWGASDRPLFVWLHGWGDSAATFQLVVDQLRRDWFVVAPDWRGFGGSRASVSSYWFPDYLADLDRLLEFYSPTAPATLIGHSIGGNIAGLYAGTMPERVRALVNVEGFGLRDSNPEDAAERYRRWIEKGRKPDGYSTYPDFAALARRIRQRNPRLRAAHAEYIARCWACEGDAGVELRADPLHKLPNPVLYRRAESEACWRRVTAPVLLLAGALSEFALASDARLETGGLDLPFPVAATQVIENAGHMMHFEAPEALAAAIEAFLEEHL